MIVLEVAGTPAPKGSARAFIAGCRAIVVTGGSAVNKANMRSWDQAVRLAANAAVRGAEAPPFVGVPIKVTIVFRLARPAGHWGKKGLRPSAPAYPTVAPDLDKLARATCDSLTGCIFDDDSRIAIMHLEKIYAEPGREGATITISSMA